MTRVNEDMFVKAGNASAKTQLVHGHGPRTGAIAHEDLYQYGGGTPSAADSDVEIQEVVLVRRNLNDTSPGQQSYVLVHGGTLETHTITVATNPGAGFTITVGGTGVAVTPGASAALTAVAIAEALEADATVGALFVATASGSDVLVEAKRVSTRHTVVTSSTGDVTVATTDAELGSAPIMVDQIVNRESAYPSETQGQVALEDASAARSSTFGAQNVAVASTHSPESLGELVYPGAVRLAKFCVTAAELAAAATPGAQTHQYALALPNPIVADRAILLGAYFEVATSWATSGGDDVYLGLGTDERTAMSDVILRRVQVDTLSAGQITPQREKAAEEASLLGHAGMATGYWTIAGIGSGGGGGSLVPAAVMRQDARIRQISVTYLHSGTAFTASGGDVIDFTVGRIPAGSAASSGSFVALDGSPHVTFDSSDNGTHPTAVADVDVVVGAGDKVAVKIDVTGTPTPGAAEFLIEVLYQTSTGLGDAFRGQWMIDPESDGYQLVLDVEVRGTDAVDDLTAGEVDVYVLFTDAHEGVAAPSNYASVFTR